MKTTPFNPFDFADTQEEIEAILFECYQDDDPQVFITALGQLAKHHGMTNVAKETGLNRESLYRTFNGKTDPKWTTITKVLNVLGINFTLSGFSHA